MTTWDKYFSGKEQASRNVHLRRYTEKEDAVLAHLDSLTAYNMYPGGQNAQVRYGPYGGNRFRGFQIAFPQCDLLDRLRERHFFYIRRYYYLVGNKRTVHFIATEHEQVADITSDAQLLQFLQENTWFARATCVSGEIRHVQVANRGQTGSSAKRCGFGASLLYLCFRNTEHFENNRGYRIDNHPIFMIGNMPQIKTGLIDNYCAKIIYVHYQRRVSTAGELVQWDPEDMENAGAGCDAGRCRDKATFPVQGQGILTDKGNKAFMYAAIAAKYEMLITFHPDPCSQGCCAFRSRKNIPDGQHPLLTDNPNGKVFPLDNILSAFNKHDPESFNEHGGNPLTDEHSINEPNFWQTKEFARHHGRDWFFCQ